MAYALSIDQPNGLVIVRFWDLFSSEVFLDYMDRLEKIGPFGAEFNLLMLLESGLKFELPTDTIRAQAKRAPQFHSTNKRLIVAEDDIAFGLSRVFVSESPTASDMYSIVRSLEEACKILDINPESLEFR